MIEHDAHAARPAAADKRQQTTVGGWLSRKAILKKLKTGNCGCQWRRLLDGRLDKRAERSWRWLRLPLNGIGCEDGIVGT